MFIRFIFNFFLFGLLFYFIYLAFPEAFNTLVSWANAAYEFIRDMIMRLYSRWGSEHPKNEHLSTILPITLYFLNRLTNKN